MGGPHTFKLQPNNSLRSKLYKETRFRFVLTRPAMSNPRPSRRFCAVQFTFQLQWKYPTYWQPVLILIILNDIFDAGSPQSHFITSLTISVKPVFFKVYRVPRIGEIASLHKHTGYLALSLKPWVKLSLVW